MPGGRCQQPPGQEGKLLSDTISESEHRRKTADALDRLGADHESWPDLSVRAAPRPPRIKAGVYEARSVDLKSFTAYRRRCVSLHFDVYAPNFVDGTVLARLAMYCRLPASGHRLSPSSKLARLFDLVGYQGRRDRLPMNLLRNKLWRVEVGDVRCSADADDTGRPRPLADAQQYSVVRAVVERLA